MSVPESLDTSQFTPWPPGALLVGGAVRDALLGRAARDLDWLVPDPAESAQRHAERVGGSAFLMDEERRHWRLALPGGAVHDFAPFRGAPGDVDADLWRRDLTCNAMALTRGGTLIDPTGGADDLARRRVRMTSAASLGADTVRPLRAVRFAATLVCELDDATKDVVIEQFFAQRTGAATAPAWERVGAELQLLVESRYAPRGFALLKALGGLAIYLPELELGRGVDQGALHHLDVLDHQLEALNQLLAGFPDSGAALRWATLLHDVGKPASLGHTPLGTPTFYGHDKVGAEMVQRALRRLRLPGEVVDRAAALVRYHMLQIPREERAVRRFVHRRRALLPDLLKLMLADREAARGRAASHAGRVSYRSAVSGVLAALEAQPAPAGLLNGDDVMALLALAPGPRVGEALAVVAEARAVGDVHDRAGAEALLVRYAAAQGWTVERGAATRP
ncbi:MAG: HD domain-containing protein [Trueperaceae bacterium]|nr:HD domain-containing protein [Trueperaceae bacterium]